MNRIVTPTDQKHPVQWINHDGTSAFLLVCEHASNVIPPRYNNLGLDEEVLRSHIAWDPGAFAVARLLSDAMNAPLLAPTASRLVYDCNRPPESDTAVPSRSEVYDIPGNQNLSAADLAERADSVYWPFRTALSEMIAARHASGLPSILVTVHSFTPVYHGVPRSVEIGVLYDSDTRFADSLLSMGDSLGSFTLQRNKPYGPEDGVTHTLQVHGVANEVANVMFEIRNDLISTAEQQRAMAMAFAARLEAAALDMGK